MSTFVNVFIIFSCTQTFNENLKAFMTEAKILAMVAKSDEFDQLKVIVRTAYVSSLPSLHMYVCYKFRYERMSLLNSVSLIATAFWLLKEELKILKEKLMSYSKHIFQEIFLRASR